MNFNFPQGHPTLIVVLKESVFILLSKSLHFYIILLIFNKLINFYRFEANSSREPSGTVKKKIGLMIIYQEVSA